MSENIKNKGTFPFTGSFQVKAADALDPRVQWDSYEDLIKKENWPYVNDTIYVYKGLIAAVGEDLWMLIDKDTFVSRLNSVGSLNSLPYTLSTDPDTGETIVVYNPADVAELYGWKIVGKNSFSVTDNLLTLN